jgi:hypothetical protein
MGGGKGTGLVTLGQGSLPRGCVGAATALLFNGLLHWVLLVQCAVFVVGLVSEGNSFLIFFLLLVYSYGDQKYMNFTQAWRRQTACSWATRNTSNIQHRVTTCPSIL